MAVDFKGLGDITVVTAGTRVQLTATSTMTPGCAIAAKATNTGNIYIGDSNVAATTAGAVVRPGETIEITGPQIGGTEEEFDLSRIYIDAGTSGDKVTVGYFARRP